MSFSNELRNELARVMPAKLCCCRAELAALLAVSGSIVKKADGDMLLRIVTENAATGRKIFKLLKEIYGLHSSVRVQNQKRFKKNRFYEVNTVIKSDNKWIFEELNMADKNENAESSVNWNLVAKSCCKRAYLRGVFLNRGFVSRPQGGYHLEIVLNNDKLAADVQEILHRLNLQVRSIVRKGSVVLYIKESEKIADFLRTVEASRALLEFENIRIIKSMRNNVNRQVNCETANLNKTVNASVRQVELIKKLILKKGLKVLSPQLRDLALLRIKYPASSLKDLGSQLEPPLSKSGVAYRMRKLESLAEKILQEN